MACVSETRSQSVTVNVFAPLRLKHITKTQQ
jgi:hypothetical protein